MNVKTLAFALSSTLALGAFAADYYVAETGNDDNDGSAEAPYLTIDKAVVTARTAGDVIHVMPGTYETTLGIAAYGDNAKWGPNVAANVKLIGEGETRDAVVLKSHGNHRTLRMEANSWVENMTLVGEPNFKADKGGVVEMSGGTLTNCVIKNGTATGNGGNIYVSGGTIVDCVIRDGQIKNTGTAWNTSKGVNVMMNGAAKMSRCHMIGGTTTKKEDGTFYYERGSVQIGNDGAEVEDCLIEQCECGGLLLQATGSKVYNTTVVNNKAYGVWSWNAKQTLVNCVIFGNRKLDGTVGEWSGDQPTASDAQFINCAMADKTLSTTTFKTLVVIDESDFADYAAGDYHPAQGSALIDAGGADPRGASASTTDLEGHPRMSGTIDIGCYEWQRQDMIVRIDGMTLDQATAPAVATFTHVAENSASPEKVTFTYDFGDGSGPETVATGTITHTYEKPGVYTVTITARNECEEEEAEMVYVGYAQIASDTVYVTLGNAKPEFPYDTPEKGFASLKAAVSAAADGYTILVGEGVYETTDQTSVGKALTIVGLGATPEGVILRNTVETPDTYYRRTIELNNAGASLANVTIENGRVKDANGANLHLAAGIVSNCVIRGGYALVSGSNAAGGGVELGSGATLTHCVITNNIVDGTSSNQGLAGGAVFVTYEATNGRVSNCLIAGNRYITSGDVPRSGTAGIRFGGRNDNTQIENNTIVANVVEGSLSEDSAGLHCTTWYGRMRNNIIAGNYETGKAKYTSVKVDKEHCTFDNNLTDDATAYTSKSFAAPLATIFKDFEKGDYTLPTTSPACNKGTKTGLVLLPSVDLLGNPREFGKAIDIGCYECQRLPGLAIMIK